MTGVILGILKVTGILLLVLVCLVLLVCILVLSVPVRYKGYAEKQPEGEFKAKGELSWLLHFLHITAERQEGDTRITVAVLGITPDMVRSFRKKRQRKKAAKKRRTAAGEKKTADGQKTVKKANTELSAEVSSGGIQQRTEKTDKKQIKDTMAKEEAAKQRDKTKQPEKSSFINRVTACIRYLLSLPEKLWQRLLQIRKNLTDKKKTWETFRAFISRQEVRAAASLVWNKLLRLLKAVRPRKLEGSLVYGFSDPADTGMVLAVLGALYPWYGSNVSVTPDFQHKTCACSLKGSGRIYGITVLVTGLQLFFDKNIQFIIKKRKKEA